MEADSERIGKEAIECNAIAADAEADLAVAMPALEKAMAEVSNTAEFYSQHGRNVQNAHSPKVKNRTH